MNVLVTGGAGYIGSHTCKLLSKNGHTPVCLDNLSTGNKWAVQWGPFYEGEIQDQKLVQEIVLKEKIDAVIHFAANAYVGESVKNPFKYYKNNIANCNEFLHALSKTQIRKIVFSSTCATYGEPDEVPIKESEPQKPVNPYGFTKYVVERMLEALAKSHGFASVSLRYFNAAGADPDVEIGEYHDPETHLIPLTIDAARKGTKLKVFGNDYDTKDGSCIRDYIHVLDLADAHLRALEKLNHMKGAHFCNLGTGKGTSVLEIIKTVEKVTGKIIDYDIENRRAGDPAELVADPSYANELIGWKARYDLNDIIEHASRWQEKLHKDILK